jgi:hypothetical protein
MTIRPSQRRTTQGYMGSDFAKCLKNKAPVRYDLTFVGVPLFFLDYLGCVLDMPNCLPNS